VPLTKYQSKIARLIAINRSSESHLAGGAAINVSPQSHRYSNDLDYFHDSAERVAESFAQDRDLLVKNGYDVQIKMNQPGFIRALVLKKLESTKIEWAHDSAWRFMPVIKHDEFGYLLHPIDLAINKLLALVGRDEARDYLDIHEIIKKHLPLGALCWAAAGKDPGFTPLSILEILKRRGKYRPEDFERLLLSTKIDLHQMKQNWLGYLGEAEIFIRSRPPQEVGCLYYSKKKKNFVAPLVLSTKLDDSKGPEDPKPHFGRPGGVLPCLLSERPKRDHWLK